MLNAKQVNDPYQVAQGLKAVVVDDHPLMLLGISQILQGAGCEVAGAFSDPRRLMPFLETHHADVATLDIGMPGLNGIEVTRHLHEKLPALKVLIITQQAEAVYIRSAFQAGAHAYVSKLSAGSELVVALAAVMRRQKYVTPGLLGNAAETELALRQLGTKREQQLTGRQREVLQLTAEGKSLKEIGSTLNVSTKTVEFHKRALMSELGLRTTAELTRFAIAHGFTTL